MFALTSRPAKLNQDHSGSSKEKDGRVTKFLNFGLEDVPLDETDLGAVTNNAYAYRAMYNLNGAQPEPFFDCFKPREMTEDVENACVEIRLHGGTEFKFTNCTVSKIRLKETKGGITHLSCRVLTESPLNASLAELVQNMGEIIDVAIHGSAPQDQAQMSLNTHGDGEEAEQGENKPRGRGRKGRNGQQPGAH